MTDTRFASVHTQVLLLEGADALEFAHMQFTSDVRALADGQWQWSGWLDPRGQVLAFFMLARLAGERLALVLRGGDGLALAKRLLLYRLRSDVRVFLLESGTLSDAPPAPAYSAGGDSARLVLGQGDWSLAWTEGDSQDRAVSCHWIGRELAAGYPWLPAHALETLLPPALGFERLGAISYGKGCYPGQEVAARIHFRGRHKRHLARVHGEHGDADALPVRWSIQGREAGLLLGALPVAQGGWDALVVLKDEVAESHGEHAFEVDDLGPIMWLQRYGD